jgi:hypothetical protein
MSELRAQAMKRDAGRCRLIWVLSGQEMAVLKINSGGLHQKIELAHIEKRSTNPELKFDLTNVVMLNSFSHRCLDDRRHPLTGESITPQEHEYWWNRIRNSTRVIIKGESLYGGKKESGGSGSKDGGEVNSEPA